MTSDRLLRQLDGPGALDPSSNVMSIGLDDHTPIEAIQRLADHEDVMSVAIHELTHFHTLNNDLGRVLCFLGLMAATLDESHAVKRGETNPNRLAAYFHYRLVYGLHLELWRPLLEGLAIYAQTAPACTAIDALDPALETLVMFGGALSTLEPKDVRWSGTRNNASLDQIAKGMLSCGYRAKEQGAQMSVGSLPLAALLETDPAERWQPYFFGHAYVRAIQRRLCRRAPKYECPEHFLNLMKRLLRNSPDLAGSTVQPDSPTGVDRVYGWLELIDRAPHERLKALESLEPSVDILRFLESGEEHVGFQQDLWQSTKRLESLLPREWAMFASTVNNVDFEALAREASDEIAADFKSGAAERVVTAWITSTLSLNICRGGRCKVVGWSPDGLGPGRHVVAIRVNDAIWWLSVSDAERAELPFGLESLRTLSVNEFSAIPPQIGSQEGVEVQVNCFISLVVRSASPGDIQFPQWHFEFVDARSAKSLWTRLGSGNGRSVLEIDPAERKRGLFAATMPLRHEASDTASRGLEGWLAAFAKNGQADLAHATAIALERQELALSRQRELWCRRITRGLLGSAYTSARARTLASSRMGSVLRGIPAIQELVAASFARPGQPRPSLIPSLFDDLEQLNRTAQVRLGRSPFDIDRGKSLVEYVGLWGNRLKETD